MFSHLQLRVCNGAASVYSTLRNHYVHVFIVGLLSLQLIGCGPQPAAKAKPAGREVAGEADQPLADADQPVAPVDGEADGNESAPAAKNPLIRGVGEVLENNPAFEEDVKHPLREQLQQADDILTEIKTQNRSALREANRQQRTRRSASPNIVMLIVNDLSVSDLSCYGPSEIHTPTIDRFAKSATRFTQFYAGSPNKADAHWCLATGRRPDEAAGRSEGLAALHPDNITVGEAMWQAGYTTGVFGDWGVLGPKGPATPADQGFDEWLGTFQSVDKSAPFPESVIYNDRPIKLTRNADGQRKQSAQDFYVAEAAAFMARNYRQRPLFMQIYLSPEATPVTAADLEQYADKPWPEVAKTRAAAISRIDRDIAILFQRLTDLKQARNTVVILTSDVPGPSMDEASKDDGRRGGPGDLYEGGLRIPLIIAAAGRIPENGTCEAVSAAWDLAPTIYQLVSALKQPTHRAGQSLVPFLQANSKLPTRFLQWEKKHGTSEIAARWKNWKVVRPGAEAAFELYDLDADAAETRNIAEQHPDILAEIKKRFMSQTEQAKR